MQSNFIKILLILLTSIILVSANDKDDTKFQWVESGLGDSEFLKPKNWFVKASYQKGHYALFISKEEISKDQNFTTGFTLNFNSHISKKTGSTPSEYAKQWIENVPKLKNKKVIVKPWEFTNNILKAFGIRVKDNEKIVHYMLVANDNTDSLFIMLFESPLKEWEEEWKIGNKIMNNLRLDAEI